MTTDNKTTVHNLSTAQLAMIEQVKDKETTLNTIFEELDEIEVISTFQTAERELMNLIFRKISRLKALTVILKEQQAA